MEQHGISYDFLIIRKLCFLLRIIEEVGQKDMQSIARSMKMLFPSFRIAGYDGRNTNLK